MATKHRTEFYKDRARKWRWRVRSRNSRIVASSGESFASRRNARLSLARFAASLLAITAAGCHYDNLIGQIVLYQAAPKQQEVPVQALIMRLLAPLLDRLGTGWKTVAGLIAMVAIAISCQMGWIGSELGDQLWKYAEILFGVGVIHKATKTEAVKT